MNKFSLRSSAQTSKYISLRMLPFTLHGKRGPLIVMLHWLGGSAKTWTEAIEGLVDSGMTCASIDLPGFGRAATWSEFSIAATTEAIIATIQVVHGKRDQPWLLAGHSMGGKFAAIIARAAVEDRSGLENLRGLVLVSPSPPGPEPMEESTRQTMIQSLGHSTLDAQKDRDHAEKFVDDNTGRLPLPEAIRKRTVDDVLRMKHAALINWLSTSSKEDWAARIGVLPVPALVLAGSEEPALGPEAQRQHTLPHFANSAVVSLTGGGHLAPLERPAELVERIASFVETLGLGFHRAAAHLAPDFRILIDSDRTSRQTRAVLDQRLADDDAPETRTVLTQDELLILRAAAARVVPGCGFDLALRVDRWLGLPQRDGWRHDELPPDTDAWRTGLQSLDAAALRAHRVPFVALDAARQDALLSQARGGELGRGLSGFLHVGDDANLFTAPQMRKWFGDVCAELTRTYIADPRTMHRIGFAGFADEGGFAVKRLHPREDLNQ